MTPLKDVVDPWGASTTEAASVDDGFGASPFTTDAFGDSAATTTASSDAAAAAAAATSGENAEKSGEPDFFADEFQDNFSNA